MIEKRRGKHGLHEDPEGGYSPSTGPRAGKEEEEDADKKDGSRRTRTLAVALSGVILLALSLLVLSRMDILHVALIHHTGDYHADNHVHHKIEQLLRIDVDAPVPPIVSGQQRLTGAQRSSTESAERIEDHMKPTVQYAQLLLPEQRARESVTVRAVEGRSEDRVHSQRDEPPVQKFTEKHLLRTEKKVIAEEAEPVEEEQNSRAGEAPKEASLQEQMERQIALVRKLKFEEHLVMETDERALREIAKLQPLVRRYIEETYGAGPLFLEMSLSFPQSMRIEGRPSTEQIIFELAPIELVPYSVFYFLQLVENWKGGAFHRRAGHVLQAMVAGGGPSLAFQEYNRGYPHVKHTLGYAGRPGGPGFYISTVDNSWNHGPASQGSKTEADSCFGRIVKGFDVVERMKKQPGAGGAGFISSSDNFIRIPAVHLLSHEESVPFLP